MTAYHRLIALVLWTAALPAGFTAWSVTKSSAQTAGKTGQTALTPQEKRGKELYLRGVSASGDVMAAVGDIDVPATTLTCAGCDGKNGRGQTEAGITTGDITWPYLIRPEGHAHATGRRHGPYTEVTFARALLGGVDPNGQPLLRAMPRYRMSSGDVADLVAYLKRIESDPDPGLTETSIVVGTILPSAGQLSEAGQAMREVLAAFFDDVNSRGGTYSRRIELRVADAGAGDAATVAASAKRLIESEQVFTFVGGITAGADREVAALSREAEVPFIGPSTLFPQTSTPPDRHVFYLLSGLKEQGRALANFASKRSELLKSPARVVYAENEFNAEVAASIEEQARKIGGGDLTRATSVRGPVDFAPLVAASKREGVQVVFFVGRSGDEKAFLKEAAAADWTPHVLMLGALASRDLIETMPVGFSGRLFLSFPTVPSDITPAGLAQFRELTERHRIAPRHTASQFAAFAAARVFVEGLKLAGRELSREKLITTLEGFYEFDTGVTPRLTFGPNRRVGATGAYVVAVDAEKKVFTPVSGWVAAN